MDQDEKKKYEKLLGNNYIERKAKRQVVKGKNGKKIPIIDIQKVTGLDDTGGIIDAEVDNIQEYDCQCVAEGRENYGGRCAICEATFCNNMENGMPTCYRKCEYCHANMCMDHVKGNPDGPVYCSLKCYLYANPAILAILVVIGIVVLFVIMKAVFH